MGFLMADGMARASLFENGDVRVVWLLRRLSRPATATRTAANLRRAARFVGADIMLTLVTAARENASAVADISMRPIDTFSDGGLDFLGRQMNSLGLPESVTSQWRPLPDRWNRETRHFVTPALIPARDQLLAYAAQMNASYTNTFSRLLATVDALATDSALVRASRIARLVWKAYSFLAPGGETFDPSKSLGKQLGQGFGCRTCLTYLARPDRVLDLDEILSRPEIDRSAWVQSAKTRVAEALFLERALQTTRELMPPGGFST